MKKGVIRLLKTGAFCAVLALCIAAASYVTERKASRIKLEPFLERPQDYDVLFVGDSHMVNAVFPMELWEDYGVAAYNLGSIGSTLPVTYWSLMNALDYAQPKLVVIGVKDVEKSYKLSGSSADVHTALDAYPLSRTKAAAIEDLMDEPYAMDDEGHYYADLKWEYYLTLGKYHSRWSEIGPGDFTYERNCQKGAEMAVRVAAPNDYDIIDENQAAEENGWGFAYLRRSIEACQSRGIEVMLVHLPYPSTEEEQMAANAVYYIAEEYGVDYVDFVNLDQVVDYDTDCYDSYSHLNPSGARKVSDFLGRYITEHYDLCDRRQDESYSHWAADEEAYRQYKLRHIQAQGDLNSLLMLLHDDSYSVCLRVNGDSRAYDDERTMTLLQNIAREHIYEEDAFSKWSCALFPLERLDEAASSRKDYFLVVDRKTGCIAERVGAEEIEREETSFGTLSYRFEQGEPVLQIERGGQARRYGRAQDEAGEFGVSVLVIDDRTGEPAAQVTL